MSLRRLTREFLLGEAKSASPVSYFQNLMETLQTMRPTTQRDARKLEIALEQANKLRREYLRMERKMRLLEERLQVLEENKND